MTDTADAPRRGPARAALGGVAAVAFGVGIAEVIAGFVAPSGSPVLAVGAALIDLAPSWAKEAAIALFGTADKIALVVGIAIVLGAAAAGAGVLEVRRPPWGRVVVGVAAVVGLAAVVTRATFSPLDALPIVVAAGGSILALGFLARRFPDGERIDGAARREFLGWSLGALAVGAIGALGATGLQALQRATQALRDGTFLPAPASPAPPVPPGAELAIDGLAPVITPNADFYRIDTALSVPRLDPASWTLRVHGLVEEPFELTWDELTALPLEESYTTLTCVSNEVGGGLIGTAKWLGYPVRDLLARARPTGGADMVLSRSVDGWTAGTPLDVLQEADRDAIVAIAMNGEPLPLEHGFPARLVVPGLYGYVSATKWVTELEVTRFADATAYWTDRGWGERGPIKLSSRIDVPEARAVVPAGEVVVAGVAWDQHTGIAAVEVQIDDGPWRAAELATAISVDTWVQWRHRWRADPGDHVVRVRATNADGRVQTAVERDVLPDGATGHHEIPVSVA